MPSSNAPADYAPTADADQTPLGRPHAINGGHHHRRRGHLDAPVPESGATAHYGGRHRAEEQPAAA
jgi:hypothetical protein